jgi:hypothetical protein
MSACCQIRLGLYKYASGGVYWSPMTHAELIAVARTHTVDFPKLSGEPWANQETLTTVRTLDSVIVSFESDQYPKKIMILLEKDSGKFIASWLAPRNLASKS